MSVRSPAINVLPAHHPASLHAAKAVGQAILSDERHPDSDRSLQDDVALISSIDAVPTILEVCCRTTGMGFAAVARVTEDRWVACAVRDEIAFGLKPGGELKVETTICDAIRASGNAVVIDHVAEDDDFLRPPDAGAVRLPELHLDADLPPRRRLLRHAVRHRSQARQAQEHAGRRHVQAVRRADQLPCRCAGAPCIERSGAVLRAPILRAARAVHRRARPRPAQSAGLHRCRRLAARRRRSSRARPQHHPAADAEERAPHGQPDRQRARSGARPSRRRAGHQPRQGRAAGAGADAGRRGAARRLARAADRGRDEASHAPADCDPARIAQLLSNLLANALVHGTGPVRVRAVCNDGALELAVANGGEPIPPR